MSHGPRRVPVTLAVAALAGSLLLAACGPGPATQTPTVQPQSAPAATGTGASSQPSPAAPPSVGPASPGASPGGVTGSGATGFPFDADAITGYYATQGYACAPAAPSTKAAGYEVRTCSEVDAAGRTHVVGVVTDPARTLADGWASLHGTASETVLAPSDALEPLGGFLGATLGPDAGAALLPWLAGHLGDAHAETTSDSTRVAVYTASATDHTTIVVEVAGPAFPAPLGVPTP